MLHEAARSRSALPPDRAAVRSSSSLRTAGRTSQPRGANLLGGLFGPTRRLYKRLAEFSHFQEREWYERIARQPYAWLVAGQRSLRRRRQQAASAAGSPRTKCCSTPRRVRREVEFHVEVFFPKENVYRTLAEVSPAVHTLATRQFDDYVKRVRIFVPRGLADELSRLGSLDPILSETFKQMG